MVEMLMDDEVCAEGFEDDVALGPVEAGFAISKTRA